jgi:hypothetical protein
MVRQSFYAFVNDDVDKFPDLETWQRGIVGPALAPPWSGTRARGAGRRS